MSTNIAHNLEDKPRTSDILIKQSYNFNSLLLSTSTLDGLKQAGFYKPSPIQVKGIPLGRCGLDLIVQAKSGTGKTAVFTIIALEMINTTKNTLQVLIFAPTREIAIQITDVIKSIGQTMAGLKVECFIGGLPIEEDYKKLKNCHIAVGAPGRLKHLVEASKLKTDFVRLLVLDEADKLMEKCFQSDINYVYHKLPQRKQVIALSATYPDNLDKFLENYMQSPTFVTPEVENPILLGLKQFVSVVKSHLKVADQLVIKNMELIRILSNVIFTQCLIFCNSRLRAEGISDKLNEAGWNTTYISAGQSQVKRIQAVDSLKKFKCKILLSTDLTARGIDAANVDLVINYDVPYETATYLHRMGRAGRYGSRGICVTIASDGNELKKLQDIIGDIGGTDLAISKLPLGDEGLHNIWECDMNDYEQIYGRINVDNKIDLKDSVFDIKNIKKKSDITEVVPSDLEGLNVHDSYSDDSQLNIQSNVKNLLNLKDKSKEKITKECSEINTETLLEGLASGESIVPNMEPKKPLDMDTESILKILAAGQTVPSSNMDEEEVGVNLNSKEKSLACNTNIEHEDMDAESILKILAAGQTIPSSIMGREEVSVNLKLKAQEKMSKTHSVIDTETLLKSLVSAESILPDLEQNEPLDMDTESIIKMLAAGQTVPSSNLDGEEVAVNPKSNEKSLACNKNIDHKDIDAESILKMLAAGETFPSSNCMDEANSSHLKDLSAMEINEINSDLISPASLYPWVPVEGSPVLMDSHTAVNLLEDSTEEEAESDQISNKKKRKCKISHLKNNKSHENQILTKNLGLYSITQLLTNKLGDSPEDSSLAAQRIQDYLNNIKQNQQEQLNAMPNHFENSTCDDLLVNIAQHSKDWCEQEASILSKKEEDSVENIFKLGYFYLKNKTKHWIDALGDKYEPEESEEDSESIEDEEEVEEEMEELNLEENDYENTTNWQPYYETHGNYSNYNNSEWMASNYVPASTSHDNGEYNSYAPYFDYYKNMFENDVHTFEDVGSFQNYYRQWKSQLRSVRDFVQQKIYLEEMNKYQYQEGHNYDYHPIN